MPVRVYYDLIQREVAGAASKAEIAAGSLDHSAPAGRVRELALESCVRPYLTHSFRCGSGKIIDTTGYLTKQIDLVVYQTKYAPPLLIGEGLGIFPAECCAYAFEVKSTLTATEIRNAIEVARSVGELRLFPKKGTNGQVSYKGAPPTVLFAFGTDASGNELERYLRYDQGQRPAIVALVVLGRGYWFWHQTAGWHGVTADQLDRPEGVFALFIAGFTNTLARHEGTLIGFSPGQYMLPSDMEEKLRRYVRPSAGDAP